MIKVIGLKREPQTYRKTPNNQTILNEKNFFLCGNWHCHSLMNLYVKQSTYNLNKVEAQLTLACRGSRLYGRYMIFRETVACLLNCYFVGLFNCCYSQMPFFKGVTVSKEHLFLVLLMQR